MDDIADIDALLTLNVGDAGRLNYMKSKLENGGTLYSSDRAYLERLKGGLGAAPAEAPKEQRPQEQAPAEAPKEQRPQEQAPAEAPKEQRPQEQAPAAPKEPEVVVINKAPQ